jgi:glycosyltransferase involved in cell wall biosynthesis
MVTVQNPKFDRTPSLKVSIESFARQTYQAKELIVVLGGTTGYIARVRAMVDELDLPNVLISEAPKPYALGALREFALTQGTGDVVCPWDDDDISHPGRLAEQLQVLLQSDQSAVVLRSYLHLFVEERQIYWCDWAKLGLTNSPGLPGTILAFREKMPSYEPELIRKEDEVLLRKLASQGAVRTIGSEHQLLYVYRYHGANVSKRFHHQCLARGASHTREQIMAAVPYLNRALCCHGLSSPLDVMEGSGLPVLRWESETLTQVQ